MRVDGHLSRRGVLLQPCAQRGGTVRRGPNRGRLAAVGVREPRVGRVGRAVDVAAQPRAGGERCIAFVLGLGVLEEEKERLRVRVLGADGDVAALGDLDAQLPRGVEGPHGAVDADDRGLGAAGEGERDLGLLGVAELDVELARRGGRHALHRAHLRRGQRLGHEHARGREGGRGGDAAAAGGHVPAPAVPPPFVVPHQRAALPWYRCQPCRSGRGRGPATGRAATRRAATGRATSRRAASGGAATGGAASSRSASRRAIAGRRRMNHTAQPRQVTDSRDRQPGATGRKLDRPERRLERLGDQRRLEELERPLLLVLGLLRGGGADHLDLDRAALLELLEGQVDPGLDIDGEAADREGRADVEPHLERVVDLLEVGLDLDVERLRERRVLEVVDHRDRRSALAENLLEDRRPLLVELQAEDRRVLALKRRRGGAEDLLHEGVAGAVAPRRRRRGGPPGPWRLSATHWTVPES